MDVVQGNIVQVTLCGVKIHRDSIARGSACVAKRQIFQMHVVGSDGEDVTVFIEYFKRYAVGASSRYRQRLFGTQLGDLIRIGTIGDHDVATAIQRLLEAGGMIVAEGTPKQVSQNEKSYTGMFLKKYFEEV